MQSFSFHISAMTSCCDGTLGREFLKVLARRPIIQTSSSYPSFDDDWTDNTYVTEYYDMYDYHDTEDVGYEDEYNEFEDYDSE